jgi:acetyl esterase/lipase
MQNVPVMERLAKSGTVVAALDFRMPPAAAYPASVADINYAVRWLKTHAREFGTLPELVGAIGNSSGSHLAMLVGMRPHDPRYSAISLPAGAPAADASLRFAVLCWPVIDPLARYRYVKELQRQGKSSRELDSVIPQHDAYWKTEDAMAEGNPVLALERGERVSLPPVLYLQGTHDRFHPRVDLDRFVAGYRKAGGHLELELFEGEDHAFLRNPSSPAVVPQALAKIEEFIHRQIR